MKTTQCFAGTTSSMGRYWLLTPSSLSTDRWPPHPSPADRGRAGPSRAAVVIATAAWRQPPRYLSGGWGEVSQDLAFASPAHGRGTRQNPSLLSPCRGKQMSASWRMVSGLGYFYWIVCVYVYIYIFIYHIYVFVYWVNICLKRMWRVLVCLKKLIIIIFWYGGWNNGKYALYCIYV
jgi:hypothetical protein